MISSPPEFALRPARPEDAEAVLELIPPELGFSLDDIRNQWRHTDLERDTWAWEHDGRLVAFGILRSRGEELSVNGFVHPDFLAASLARIGVPVELTVVASEIGSYKPGHRHWERFFAETGADRARHVHVAASLFHDVAPTRELGLTSVWINRLGERADPEPTRELPDLTRLPETLDDLVAA